jgi:lysophospholipase L1-like esterase
MLVGEDFSMKMGWLMAILVLGVPVMALGQGVMADPPQAIDPIYTAPSLSADQVKHLQALGADWPQLARYREDNAKLGPPGPGEKRVVFYGDSITDAWGRRGDATRFFPGKPYVNRGISGQTTAQMLVRFEQDVVHLRPAAVVILAGTNDIAGNTGLASLEMIEDNFEAMVAIAKANGIRVVLSSVLPVTDYPWRRGLQPAGKVKALNAWLKSYAKQHACVYLDYYSPMANAAGGLDPQLAVDGVHPTSDGYAIMAPLAQKAVDEALAK